MDDTPWLARAAGETLAEQLAARYSERITQRLLAPGARLPSVRDCARRHRVSASTVVGAYERLQARGLVEARPQRGFFVRETAPARALPASPTATAPMPLPVDATALIRSMFQAQSGRPAPGMGTLPQEWLDAALLQRALRRVGQADASAWLRYGEPAGDGALRQALAQRLADLGIPAAPAQIMTSMGATHGLDIVSRTLLRPGDAVLVDEPGWSVEFARLTAAGMRLLPVPRGVDGPDLAALEALARAHAPRLYATVSVLHNPTGTSLGAAAAHQVLRIAEAHDFLIAEDDTYAWLAPAHAPRLAQLDGLRRTIYVSGFAKILTPQWRVGFVAAAPALIERFIDTKLLGSLGTPGPLEHALAWCLEQGLLRRHAERIGARLDTARARVVRLAEAAGCRFVTPPQGLFGWIDVGADTERLAQNLLDEGWLTAPGVLFHPTRRPTTLMRVNFATSLEPAFWRRLRELADAG
ncbi:GntR family transcriptional regulator [Rubrivivax gelatinosus]|uniref:GntR family transcriptional regulator n=1 Tax=Rubrivivax gelatinosus TaxID=28068 RepID=A0ABS1DPX6_RUBGE|nr:PLP-dependent aminotransferase family protein [Rubrivivax gelatinosus]MBK1615455.1 GntR family transcriptional regulator [Rubrivivax gelatinosus]MBK1712059.1 GntR family transcriptional regulator [Rubrivivax gelatinosus]